MPRSFVCITITSSLMEITSCGGDREQVKVWKERETLVNIELH